MLEVVLQSLQQVLLSLLSQLSTTQVVPALSNNHSTRCGWHLNIDGESNANLVRIRLKVLGIDLGAESGLDAIPERLH